MLCNNIRSWMPRPIGRQVKHLTLTCKLDLPRNEALRVGCDDIVEDLQGAAEDALRCMRRTLSADLDMFRLRPKISRIPVLTRAVVTNTLG